MVCMAAGDIGRRVRTVRESIRPYAPKANWLAQQIGVSAARLSNWENGKHDPDDDYLEKIAKALGVPVGTLLDGTDGPSSNTVNSPQLGMPSIPVGFPPLKIRYAGEVPAGDWGDPLGSNEFVEVEAEFEHPKRFECRVIGMSCYPALRHDDRTIWHSDLNPAPGLIVLAQRRGDHGCTVKELVWDEASLRNRLVPINPAYDEPDDGDGWGVIARLVAVIRKSDRPKKTWYWPDGLKPSDLMP